MLDIFNELRFLEYDNKFEEQNNESGQRSDKVLWTNMGVI